jgi:hypothetical protein
VVLAPETTRKVIVTLRRSRGVGLLTVRVPNRSAGFRRGLANPRRRRRLIAPLPWQARMRQGQEGSEVLIAR